MRIQSMTPSGSTAKIRPPTLTMNNCPITMAVMMPRNARFCQRRRSPLTSGVRERQLIMFQTWNRT